MSQSRAPRAVTHEGSTVRTRLNGRAAAASLLLGSALIVAACGWASTPAATAAPTPLATTFVDADGTGGGACDLVDPALVEDALGGPVDDGSAGTDPASAAATCVYRSRGSDRWVSVAIFKLISRPAWDAQQAANHMDEADPVDDLGEIAHLVVDGSTGLRLAAFGSGHGVEVFVSKRNMDVHRSAAPEEIVRAVLLKLG